MVQHLRTYWLPIFLSAVGVIVATVAGWILYALLDDLVSATELRGPTTATFELDEGELNVFNATSSFGEASSLTLIGPDGTQVTVRPDREWGTQTFQDPFQLYSHFATADIDQSGTYELTIAESGDYAVTPDPITELRAMIPSAIVTTVASLIALVGLIWWPVAWSRDRKRQAAQPAATQTGQPVSVAPPAAPTTSPPAPSLTPDDRGPGSLPPSSSDTPW